MSVASSARVQLLVSQEAALTEERAARLTRVGALALSSLRVRLLDGLTREGGGAEFLELQACLGQLRKRRKRRR